MTNIEAARAFLNTIKDHKELQKQLALVDWDEETSVRIARDIGFVFSVDDLLAAIDEQNGDLTDEELSTISGGWSRPPSL